MTDSRESPETPAATGKPKKKSMIFRVAFGVLTLLLLIVFLDPKEIAHDLGQTDLRYVLAGFGMCVFCLFVRALKWQLIMLRLGIRVPYVRLLETYTISYWFNTFLPGSIGGDLYKVYDVSRATNKKIRPVVTVLIERLTGVLSLMAVTLAALITYRQDLPIPSWVLSLIIAAAIGLTLSLMATLMYFRPLWNLATRLVPAIQKVMQAEKVHAFALVSNEIRHNYRLFTEAFLTGILVQVTVLVSYYLLARAVSDQVSPHYFFTLFPLVELASMAPISINGMGIREGLTVFSMHYYHITPALSLSMGIMFRLVAFALAALGGLVLIVRRSSN